MTEIKCRCAICGEHTITRIIDIPQLISIPKPIFPNSNIYKLDYSYKVTTIAENVCEKCIAKIIVAIYGLKAPELREDPNTLEKYLEDIKWR